ncbi:hypothetical protein LPJ72_004383 [Coemansia sp. Benny D160-2]|nr:hypothetical protein LPJ72_004383 [Coemansia sp. Benny D160-2]
MAPYFFPPMWEQRRICIARVLRDYGAESVLEVGCGEGNILSFLVSEAATASDGRAPITRLYGVDVRKDSLDAARDRLVPDVHDYREARSVGLCIELYHGDGTRRIEGVDADAVVCSEVLEHVDEAVGVPALTNAILGAYRPRLAVFTTPNTEFNANFAPLNYGKPDAKFRDADHKFEWTRAQFEAWATAAAARFGYAVELLPIGVKMRNAGADFVSCGGCTQMAVFERTGDAVADADVASGGLVSSTPPVLLHAIEYPTHAALLGLVTAAAATAADAKGLFQADGLWADQAIKQQFRQRAALEAWLQANSAHTTSALRRSRSKAAKDVACYSFATDVQQPEQSAHSGAE